jgi:hypothetical protein
MFSVSSTVLDRPRRPGASLLVENAAGLSEDGGPRACGSVAEPLRKKFAHQAKMV